MSSASLSEHSFCVGAVGACASSNSSRFSFDEAGRCRRFLRRSEPQGSIKFNDPLVADCN